MSPAPIDKKSKPFSNRIRKHPKLVQTWPTPHDTNPCVWYVDDQLLVARRVLPQVQKALPSFGITAKPLTTLFTGLKGIKPDIQNKFDVDVLTLRLKNGQPLAPKTSVATITHDLRTKLSDLKGQERAVSPNHILVPAWEGDACPHLSPKQYSGVIPSLATGTGSPQPKITLIDSGYQWDQSWGMNPLSTTLGFAQPDPTRADWPKPGGGWGQCPPDLPDAMHPPASGQPIDANAQRLDGLAGHANFVAGVLAQMCQGPHIDIWNHNGAFVGADLSHVPTELAVLRTLLNSQQKQATRVILMVFAFPPFEGVLSDAWDSTFTQLKAYNSNFVLVAPAGNQASFARRYPAALATPDPNPMYGSGRTSSANRVQTNVIGVGSLKEDGVSPSDFTNHNRPPNTQLTPGGATLNPDNWVTCAAKGEQVASTFLHVDLPPEDQPTVQHNFKGTNWAEWQGTSFAAPKIAALIANQLQASNGSAKTAWNAVKSGKTQDPKLGYLFAI